jgi:hypothetical protein
MGNTKPAVGGARFEHAELARTRARGISDTWGVQALLTVSDDWAVFRFENERIYAPLEHSELAHQFARGAESPTALRAFLQSYGRLGWEELVEEHPEPQSAWLRDRRVAADRELEAYLERDEPVYVEPVDWIRAHAQTVEWCLAAAEALTGERTARARTKRCERLAGTLPSPAGLVARVSVGQMPRQTRQATHPSPPVEFVGRMLEDYLRPNLRGVRRRVKFSEGRLRTMWGGDSLLESIYTAVADAATGGRLAQCAAADCGAVFIQTDERQRFCPPRAGQEKSACMNRERVRRYRQKKGQS